MTRLQELVGRPPKREWKLPAWLDRVLSVGIVSTSPEVIRRQRFFNIAAFAVAADSLSHLISNSIHDFHRLLPVNIYNVVMIVLALLLPLLHRYGELAAGIALTFLVLTAHLLVVWWFGIGSNIEMYFAFVPGLALLFFGVQHWRIFALFFVLSVIAVLVSLEFAPFDGLLIADDPQFRDSLSTQVLLNAITINSAMLFYALSALRLAELRLQDQHERSEALVQTVMPATIAERLKAGEQHIADRIEMLTVMFADLVGFTAASHDRAPEEVVEFLDKLVHRFDAMCDRYGVEKIKTIGDCYMAAAGFEGLACASAVAVGHLALAMLDEVRSCASLGSRTLEMRIGIHSGPATAGVIGDRRFSYDVWGDAVNTASRMESYGQPGRIQVSDAFRSLAGDAFAFEEHGPTEIKGIGFTRTYFLIASSK